MTSRWPIPRCGAPECDGATRCEECREKARKRFKTRLKYRQQMLAENPDLRPHGDAETYNAWGCRCTECRNAATRNRYRWGMSNRTALSEHKEGLRGKAQPFGREWLDETA